MTFTSNVFTNGQVIEVEAISTICGTFTATIAVAVNSAPTVMVTQDAIGLCPGVDIDLTSTPGFDSYEYFDDATNTSLGVFATNTATISGLVDGQVVRVDATSAICGTFSDLVTIQISTVPAVMVTQDAIGLCPGVDIDLTSTPGFDSYEYFDDATNTSLGVFATNTATISGLVDGQIVRVDATSAICGTFSDVVTIQIGNAPSVTVTQDAIGLCPGVNIDLTSTSGFDSYEYFDDATNISLGVFTTNTATLSGLVDGQVVRVEAISAICGTFSDVVTIQIGSAPSVTVTQDAIGLCPGADIDLTSTPGFDSYEYFDDATNTSLGVFATNTATIGGLVDGQVIRVDAISAVCGTFSDLVTIQISGAPSVAVTQDAIGLCPGVDIDLTSTPGFDSYEYFDDASNTSLGVFATNTVTLSGLVDGQVVRVEATSAVCGVFSDVVTIQIGAAPTVMVVQDAIGLCAGVDIDLTSTTGFDSYEYFDDATNTSLGVFTSNTATLSGLIDGQVIRVDAVSAICGTFSDLVTIQINAAPSVTVVQDAIGFCPGVDIDLTSTPGFDSYEYFDDATNTSLGVFTTNTVTLSGLINGQVIRVDATSAICGNFSDLVTIQINTAPSVTVTQDAIGLCAGVDIDLTSTAGFDSYEYFDDATNTSLGVFTANTATLSGLVDGQVIRVDATSAICGNFSDLVTIQINAAPSVTVTQDAIGLCAGIDIDLTSTAGFDSYEYFDDATNTSLGVFTTNTATLSGLGDGQVIRVDAVSAICGNFSDLVTIQIGNAPSVIVTQDAIGLCAGVDIDLTSTPGFDSYEYFDDATNTSLGVFTTNTATISGLADGQVVRVDATSAICGNFSDLVTIQINAAPSVTVTQDAIGLCAGVDISLTSTAGFDSYEYFDDATNTSLGIFTTNTATISGLVDGQVIRVDATSAICGNFSDLVTIQINVAPSVTLTQDAIGLCAGVDIDLTSTPGFDSYEYFDDATNTSLGVFTTNTATLSGLIDGQVIRVDAISAICGNFSDVVAIQINAVPSVTLTQDAVGLCTGIDVDLTSTPGFDSYEYFDDATNTSLGIFTTNTVTLSGLIDGQVVRVDAISAICGTFSDLVTIQIDVAPIISVSQDVVLCPGSDLSFTASAGFDQYIYLDSASGTTLAGPIMTNTVSLTGLTQGQTIQVIGVSAVCPNDTTFIMAQFLDASNPICNPPPVGCNLIAIVNTSDAACEGVDDGIITVQGLIISGGVGPFEFSLDSGMTFVNNATFALQFTSLPDSTYFIVVRDILTGCESIPVAVNIDNTNNIQAAGVVSDATCAGGDGSIDLIVDVGSGLGSGNFSFDWRTEPPSAFTATTEDIFNLAPNTYVVTITDDVLGCQVELPPFVLNGPTPLEIVLDSANSILNPANCFDPASIAIDVVDMTQIPDVAFSWTGPNGFTSMNEDLVGLQLSGFYNLIATNTVSGCQDSLSVEVVIPPADFTLAVINEPIIFDSPTDNAELINLEVSGTIVGPLVFSWIDQDGSTANIDDPTIEDPTVSQPGTYTVTVTDQGVGCVATLSVIVAPFDSNGGGDPMACGVFTITVDVTDPPCDNANGGSVAITVTGGVPNYTLNFGNGLFSEVSTGSFLVENLSEGVFPFTITDGVNNVCDSLVVTLIQETRVMITSVTNPVGPVCFGESTGQVTIDAIGSETGQFFFSLNGTDFFEFTPGLPITGLPAGTFPILIGDRPSDPCVVDTTITLNNQNTQITFDFSTTDASCNQNDGSFTLVDIQGGQPPYQASFGFGNNPIAIGETMQGLSGGFQNLTIVDANNCQIDTTVLIPSPALVILNPTVVNPTCDGNGQDGAILVEIDGMTPVDGPYTVILLDEQGMEIANIEILTSQRGENILLASNLVSAPYSIIAFSTNPFTEECPTQQDVTISEGPTAVDFEIISITNAVCFGGTGSLTLDNFTVDQSLNAGSVIIELTRVGEGVVFTRSFSPDFLIVTDVIINGDDFPSFTEGFYSVAISQEQTLDDGMLCIVNSDSENFEIIGPDSPLGVIAENAVISLPDRPTGSFRVVVDPESGAAPYEASIELTNNTFPGQSLVTGFRTLGFNQNELQFETTFDTLFAGTYTVTLRDTLGCEVTTTIDIDFDMEVFVPNVFTPNGDGINDTFFVRNLPPEGAVLTIVNRLGQVVFEDSNYSNEPGWDGDNVPPGIYFWSLDANGVLMQGWVEIIRADSQFR